MAKQRTVYQDITHDDDMVEELARHQDMVLNVMHAALCARLGVLPEGPVGDSLRDDLCDEVVCGCWDGLKRVLKAHGFDKMKVTFED